MMKKPKRTCYTMKLTKTEADLAASLSAAAHLIHGSSDGRFSVTYCTELLSKEEIEGVCS